MMRAGDKFASYRVLASTLRQLTDLPWRLVVAGDGSARPEIEAALESAAPGRACFLGTLAARELAEVYAACDLYAWPAVNEAYGMALLEAQAAGLPVVSCATRGVPDVVIDGRTGILVKNENLLAEALRELLVDAERRAALGGNAAAFIASREASRRRRPAEQLSRRAMTVLALMRHADTAWSVEGRIQGRTDVPLLENVSLSLPEACRGMRIVSRPGSLRPDRGAPRRAGCAREHAPCRDGLGPLGGRNSRRLVRRAWAMKCARTKRVGSTSRRSAAKAPGSLSPIAHLAGGRLAQPHAYACHHPPRRHPRHPRRGERLGHARQAAGEARLASCALFRARRARNPRGPAPQRAVRVFFYVQHLLGIGHLKRAAAIARALRAAGFEVTLASGGAPVEGIEVLQLPPVSSPDFKQLIDGNGKPVDEAWKARRTAALLDAFHRARSDILVIELFPFGRRQMRFELLALLEAAHQRNPRPLWLCSCAT